jgi:carboxypeptidase C (cathepsin A)
MTRPFALLAAAALLASLWTPIAAQEPQHTQQPAVEQTAQAPANDNAARRPEGQGAQRRPAGERPPEQRQAEGRRLPADSVTHHVLELPGRSVRFTATAGALPLVDPEGKLQAEIGFVAYTLDGAAEPGARPVTFALNGGPGAASAYLHLGVLGPWRLPLDGPSISPSASPALAPNGETWLDFTDLVFIDPVDTGYSRATGSADSIRDRYFTIDGDVATLSAVITRWLRQNDRLKSPKFLVGESYGGFRAPRIAHELQKDIGVGLNGIVMLSPVLDFSWFSQPRHAPWVHAVRLPSYIAAAREPQGPLDREALRDAERYAAGDYLVDLTRGLQDKEAVERIVARVQALTGLDPEVVRRRAGRLDTGTVQRELGRARGRIVSAYDAGVSGYDPDPTAAYSEHEDPGLTAMTAPLTSAIVTHLWQTLNWKVPDSRYNLLNGSVNGNWRWGRGRGAPESLSALRQALALDGNLQVLVAHGFTDLVTPYFASDLLLRQLPDFGPDRVRLSLYPGGHMFYSRDASRAAFREDALRMYRAAIGARVGEGAGPAETR